MKNQRKSNGKRGKSEGSEGIRKNNGKRGKSEETVPTTKKKKQEKKKSPKKSAPRGLGCPCVPRMGWEGLGKVKTNHDKGFVFFKVPKSGVGRVWSNLTVKSTSLQVHVHIDWPWGLANYANFWLPPRVSFSTLRNQLLFVTRCGWVKEYPTGNPSNPFHQYLNCSGGVPSLLTRSPTLTHQTLGNPVRPGPPQKPPHSRSQFHRAQSVR